MDTRVPALAPRADRHPRRAGPQAIRFSIRPMTEAAPSEARGRHGDGADSPQTASLPGRACRA